MDRRFLSVWMLVPWLVCIVYYGYHTLDVAYHYDTIAYVENIRGFLQGGSLAQRLPSRFLNSVLYLPFVALADDAGVKYANVLAMAVFVTVYFHVVRNVTNEVVASSATLLVAFAPATIITVTHLKEDLNALLFCVIALALLQSGRIVAAGLAGATYGLAILSKEFALVLLPFVVLYTPIADVSGQPLREIIRLGNWRRWALGMGLLILCLAGVVVVLSPHHAGMVRSMIEGSGYLRVMMPFSSMQSIGFDAWQKGSLFLSPACILALGSVIAAIRGKQWIKVWWMITAVGTFFFFSNTTVVRDRQFMPVVLLAAPWIAEGLLLGVTRIQGWLGPVRPQASERAGRAAFVVVVFAGGMAIAHAWRLQSTLDYRHGYHAQREFFAELCRRLPTGAHVYGMEMTLLASHFAGEKPVNVYRHKVQPSRRDAQRIVTQMRGQIDTAPVFLLPDFFAYDADRHLEREVAAEFGTEVFFRRPLEGYRQMSYLESVETVAERLRRRLPQAELIGRRQQPYHLADGMETSQIQFVFRSRSRLVRQTLFEFEGCHLPLTYRAVHRLLSKE